MNSQFNYSSKFNYIFVYSLSTIIVYVDMCMYSYVGKCNRISLHHLRSSMLKSFFAKFPNIFGIRKLNSFLIYSLNQFSTHTHIHFPKATHFNFIYGIPYKRLYVCMKQQYINMNLNIVIKRSATK